MLTALRDVVLTAIGALMLALPASALAVGEAEPNNGIHQADGPLTAGTPYDGTISSYEDYDVYILYASGPGEIDVALANLPDGSDCCGTVDMWFMDGDGIVQNHVLADTDETVHITYGSPGRGVYYVGVGDANPGDKYRLTASGPVTGGPRPGPATQTPNGHASLKNAFGPLTGGKLYGGRLDSYEEEDWFFFYTRGKGRFDVAVTNVNPDSSACCAEPDVVLKNRSGTTLSSIYVAPDEVGHLSYDATGAAKFVVAFSDSAPGDQYQFRITPASLITKTVPPRETKACADAIKARKQAKKRLDNAKAKRDSATTEQSRKNWQKKVNNRRNKLNDARDAEKDACT